MRWDSCEQCHSFDASFIFAFLLSDEETKKKLHDDATSWKMISSSDDNLTTRTEDISKMTQRKPNLPLLDEVVYGYVIRGRSLYYLSHKKTKQPNITAALASQTEMALKSLLDPRWDS